MPEAEGVLCLWCGIIMTCVCCERRGALIMPGALGAPDDWLFGISATLPASCPSAPGAPEVLPLFPVLSQDVCRHVSHVEVDYFGVACRRTQGLSMYLATEACLACLVGDEHNTNLLP